MNVLPACATRMETLDNSRVPSSSDACEDERTSAAAVSRKSLDFEISEFKTPQTPMKAHSKMETRQGIRQTICGTNFNLNIFGDWNRQKPDAKNPCFSNP